MPPMQNVRMYTTRVCWYCRKAKSLLDKRGIPFTEIDVGSDAAARTWLVNTTGQRTVPQIFIGELSIGGFDELSALDRAGKLQPLLDAVPEG